MNRPKVCHIIHDGSGQGGGATFSLAYFPAYLEFFDTIAITGDNGDLAARLRARGVETYTLPMARPVQAFFSTPGMIGILRQERPDVVIVHGQWAGLFGSLAARLAGVKVVLYYTQFPSFYSDWDLFRVIRNRLAESLTCRWSSKVICLSAAGKYQYLLRRLAPEEKILHIPNGLDPAALTESLSPAALRAQLNLPENSADPVVVSVSRLADQKRIDWLLRAWAIVERRSPRAQLAIVGSGPEEKSLHDLACELQLERCHFLGPRPNGYTYFRAANCGVICSMYEGQPLALIEAMFVGCPMVGTQVDGIGETIVDSVTGRVVPPADPEALASAILELLADPECARRMGAAAQARANELYHCDHILHRQFQLVRDELAGRA